MAIGIVVLATGCARGSDEYVDVLAQMESDEYEGSQEFEAEKQRLEAKIQDLRKEVEARVTATANLGLHYYGNEMYEYALQSFTEAMRVSPTNALLFYYSGVSAAYVAKTRVDAGERAAWFGTAEAYYRRAVEIEPTLVRALYGYAVLLEFELERPWDAKPLLERILVVEKKNFDAMFVLARVHYELGEISLAVQLYRRIVDESRSSETQAAARELLIQLGGDGGDRR